MFMVTKFDFDTYTKKMSKDSCGDSIVIYKPHEYKDIYLI